MEGFTAGEGGVRGVVGAGGGVFRVVVVLGDGFGCGDGWNVSLTGLMLNLLVDWVDASNTMRSHSGPQTTLSPSYLHSPSFTSTSPTLSTPPPNTIFNTPLPRTFTYT